MNEKKRPELAKSEIVRKLPLACSNELAAVEFLEEQRWGDTPCCVHCGSVSVYKMKDEATGERNKRFLWRCKDCKKQYTVRIGTVYEESRIELRHWCYAFWAACSSKKGVSALQIKRHTQLSYKSALFLMHRIRFAMAPDHATAPKLSGTVEADETYVGGKPRYRIKGNQGNAGKDTKTPVFAVVERKGQVRAKVMPVVNSANLKAVMQECIDMPATRLMTDEARPYTKLGREFGGGHEVVKHSAKEYARGDATTNTIEGFFSLLKRGMIGTFHAVSKEHLHRYVAEFEFRYNHRKENDGDRTVACIKAADGKRLKYRKTVC